MAEVTAAFDAHVQLASSGESVDCSAVLDVLSLGLARGTRVCLTARGPEADKVLTVLSTLLCQTEDP